jgi:hypothetical protein
MLMVDLSELVKKKRLQIPECDFGNEERLLPSCHLRYEPRWGVKRGSKVSPQQRSV